MVWNCVSHTKQLHLEGGTQIKRFTFRGITSAVYYPTPCWATRSEDFVS